MRGEAGAALGLTLAPADTFWALGSLCNLLRLPFDAGLLARAHPPPHALGTLIEALHRIGCEADLVFVEARGMESLALPAIVFLAAVSNRLAPHEPAPHAVRPALLVRVDGERALFFAAGANVPTTCARADFAALYAGFALRVAGPKGTAGEDDVAVRRRFGFRWFVPELAKHRAAWRDVLAASFALQALALLLPLLAQVIVDKVIVHRATSTLAAIALALGLVVGFGALLGWLRQYIVIHTGSRVDAVLGATVFRHLCALPLRYFEARPTGVLVARLAGIETIREFVCGAAIALALDVPFLLLFVAVMLLYSVPLTLLALAAVALLVVASAVAAPLLQRRFDAQFLAGARAQAFLTEHIAGMETVKSLGLEPHLDARYRALLGDYLGAGFRTRQAANTYQSLAGGIEQLMSAAILCVGAWLAMTRAEFTIGMLVAFQMFAGRLAQPLLRLAGLWQQFQQAAIAVRRLGDVMDVPAEPCAMLPARATRGAGRIEFAGLGFRHAPDRPWLYRGFEATIEPGELCVVTGASGCGKSTLLRLLLALALPVEGSVRIDGRDTRAHAANELRARFGVVPQEVTLFAGTVLANVQLGDPHAGFADVVKACKLAGIHETIEALPEGYRSELGERGVGLSGGQRQRLALARALLRRPQILLLDEPFAQLDEASAARVAASLGRLKRLLTIVVVTHQLPAALALDRRIELGRCGTPTAGAAGGRA